MANKPTLSARIGDRTMDRLEQYADREGISKSEAADRMLAQGLDVEESDMRLVRVTADGGWSMEDQQQRLRELERQGRNQDRLMFISLLSVLWIAGELTFGYPGWLVIISGILLVIGLVASLVLFWGGRNE